MNEKQQQLTFDKGITSVPSDALCSDNALEESLGMVYDSSEHRVIQKPAEYITGMINGAVVRTLLYVHKLNNVERYIIRESNYIKWGTKSNANVYQPAQEVVLVSDVLTTQDIVLFTASGDVSITSIGQTLIITDNDGLHYYRFNGNGYEHLSMENLTLGFQAKLYSPDTTLSAIPLISTSTGDAEGIIQSKEQVAAESDVVFNIVSGKQEQFNNLVTGLYAKNLKAIASNKGFAEPFFVRAALEMYDGSYTYITNPILLWPSVTENTRFYVYTAEMPVSVPARFPKKFLAVTQELRLYVRQATSFSKYTDIIKDVVVFASKPIKIYDTLHDQDIVNSYNVWQLADNVSSHDGTEYSLGRSIYNTVNFTPDNIDGLVLSKTTLRCLANRAQKDIDNDIASSAIFYKIASLGTNAINDFVDIGNFTTQEVLENLTTQERLQYDDYYSRCKLLTKTIYAYNSRLNMANVSRGFFDGFVYFMPFEHSDTDANIYTYTFDVNIKTSTGEVRVRNQSQSTLKQGIYFFYPDARATHVKIYKTIWGGDTSLILDEDLKEHPSLNGAYYYAGFSPTTDEPEGITIDISHFPGPPETKYETLYNQIIQSEVNNPFLFLASGYHTVGTGEIIGICAITQALSQGQFGTFPLIVFSENGIWAMSVDGTGLYLDMSPMSREVCNNKVSITQTDGAAFFASEKGLMVVNGSQVKCVSDQLSGMSPEPFANFLKNAVIAYDYRDSMLWIFTDNGTNAWIFSIKSGTFGRYGMTTEGTPVHITVVNNYPDYLIQNGTTVYSLLCRPNINEDYANETYPRQYTAYMKTRPMKLENALALKSIMQIRHILQFTPYAATETEEDHETHETVITPTTQKGSMTLQIFASNNLDHGDDNWVELHSLRGTPWKYYKFQYNFLNLIATDRFAGTMLITQERRTNKLR